MVRNDASNRRQAIVTQAFEGTDVGRSIRGIGGGRIRFQPFGDGGVVSSVKFRTDGNGGADNVYPISVIDKLYDRNFQKFLNGDPDGNDLQNKRNFSLRQFVLLEENPDGQAIIDLGQCLGPADGCIRQVQRREVLLGADAGTKEED